MTETTESRTEMAREMNRVARALHRADFSVPCPWRHDLYDKCPMRVAHHEQAVVLCLELAKVEVVA